jgi:hypothetical protein
MLFRVPIYFQSVVSSSDGEEQRENDGYYLLEEMKTSPATTMITYQHLCTVAIACCSY